MAFKKFTIVLLPDGVRSVRQYKIPRVLIHLLLLIFIASTFFISTALRDYYNIKKQVPKIAGLARENSLKDAQIAALAGRIDEITGKMVELKQFDNKLKVMVNLEPGDDNTQFLGVGGSDPTLMNKGYTFEEAHQNMVRLMHNSLDNLDTEITIQTQEKSELLEFLESQKSVFACTPSIWPTKGWVSSRFGYRTSPFTNEREFHSGLDISARMESPIISPADGVVESVSKEYGYGNLLTINHGYGLKTRYAHLSKALVKKGQAVKRGEKIALVGNTGRSTGSHLHYEVLVKGVQVDPLKYILN